MDFVDPCIDEIALEGLDGITLSSLWKRLETRVPNFPLRIDEQSTQFIWANVAKNRHLEFYELAKSRPVLVIYNRYDYLDEDTGTYYEPSIVPEDIYPLNIINEDGVRGSCSTYHSRKNVTNLIRDYQGNLLWMLQEVVTRWGDRLVIVASQERRNLALMGPHANPFLKLKDIQYCILERIGRARWNGELVTGIVSLNVFKQNSKTQFYFRKALILHNLIKKQVHVHAVKKPLKGNFHIAHVKLLHLTRFYVLRKSNYVDLMDRLCEYLEHRHNNMETIATITHDLNTDAIMLKRLTSHGVTFIKPCYLPISQVYPDVPDSKKYTKNNAERVVKMLKLMKSMKDDDEFDDDGENENCEPGVPQTKLDYDYPMMTQAYNYLCEQGPEGISIKNFGHGLGLSHLDARGIMKNMDRMGVAFSMMVEHGRQRITRMVAEIYRNYSHHKQLYNREQGQLLELTSHEAVIPTEKTPDPKKYIKTEPKTIKAEQLDPDCTVIHDITAENEVKALDVSHQEQEAFRSTKKDSANLTLRWLKRANMIIESVRKEQIIDNITLLKNKIIEIEKAEGREGVLDRKSLERIINRLAKEGQIKSIKTVIKHNNLERRLHFLCDKNISVSDRRIQSVIDRTKMNIMGLSFTKSKSVSKNKPRLPQVKSEIVDEEPDVKLVSLQSLNLELEYDQSCGRKYGLEPKMRRLEIFHKFLFYLVRDYQGSATNTSYPQSVPAEIHSSIHDGEIEVMVDDLSWKRFVRPLPYHPGFSEGWFYLSDIILRIPIMLFCQLVSINYKIPELPSYLNDPISKLYPLEFLPPELVQKVLFKRKYVFAMKDLCSHLCYLGLMSLGPQHEKEKDRLFAYVHTLASLKDTQTSEPGYRYIERKEYEEKTYLFTGLEDIDQYWLDLELISINTKLGVRNEKPENETYSYRNDTLAKPELMKTLKPKTDENIEDDGCIPGDGLGAAGIDSCFYAHRRNNWSWTKLDKDVRTLDPKQPKDRLPGLNTVEVVIKDMDGNPIRVEQVFLSSISYPRPQKGGKGLKRKQPETDENKKPPVKVKKTMPKKKKVPTATLR